MKRTDYFSMLDSAFYTPDNLTLARAFHDTVRNHIQLSASRAFEVGCGYGLSAGCMIGDLHQLTVFDVDLQALEFIKWKYGDEIKRSYSFEIPVDADFIYFFMSLHHISDYREILLRCIEHVVSVNGKGIAICELVPNRDVLFHVKEYTPFDGLGPEDFEFIKDVPGVSLIQEKLPLLSHNGNNFLCYALIIKPLILCNHD